MKASTTSIALFAVRTAALARGVLDDAQTPGNLSDAEYTAFFRPELRNATGSITFDGYNISDVFPPNKTLPGWEATIQVATVEFIPGGPAYPGTRITFSAPEGLTLPVNASELGWHGCVSLLPPEWLKSSLRGKKGEEGNSCSFLSKDCQAALQAAADSNFWYDDPDSSSTPGCTNAASIPKACKDESSSDYKGGLSFHPPDLSDFFNGSTAISRAPSNEFLEPFVVTSDELKEAYDVSLGGYWTVLISWGRRSPYEFDPMEEPQGSVLCLKASELENGSEISGAARLLHRNALTWLAGFAAAYLLL